MKDDQDRFYTNEQEAERLLYFVKNRLVEFDFIIEPCVGDGALVRALESALVSPNLVLFEKNPTEAEFDYSLNIGDVLKRDFSGFENTCIVMNPPFGKNANKAIEFFNHFASFSGIGAIFAILPKTFRKNSVHNRLNKFFHLENDFDYKSHFLFENKEIDVPCCFQVWERRDVPRTTKNRTTSEFIEFTTKECADIAVRRAGGKAGQILDGLDHSKSSTYFIKLLRPDSLSRIQSINLDVAGNTVGVKSISKHELITLIEGS